MDCILYSSLVMKYNQISQDVSITAHFSIYIKKKNKQADGRS